MEGETVVIVIGFFASVFALLVGLIGKKADEEIYVMKRCSVCSYWGGCSIKTIHLVSDDGWTCITCDNFVRREKRWSKKNILGILGDVPRAEE